MALVWREKKLIYFAAPGTGSTAFMHFLRTMGVKEFLPEDNIGKGKKQKVSREHLRLDQLRKHGLWAPEFDGYTKAVGIRNPFAWHFAIYNRLKTKRAASAQNPSWAKTYPRKLKQIQAATEMGFAEFLQRRLSGDVPFEPHEEYHKEIDFFIHQERLADDAARLCELIGVPQSARVEAKNVTGENVDFEGYKAQYTPGLIKLVYKMNKPFFDKFPEYSFEGIAPEK